VPSANSAGGSGSLYRMASSNESYPGMVPDRIHHVNIFVSDWELAPARLDSDALVCAIGDVHGQLGHLSALMNWLRFNVLNAPAKSRHLIALGDYVDRGPHNIATLDFVGRLALPGVQVTRLWGNHDLCLEAFLNDDGCDLSFIEHWLQIGGSNTLDDLGFHYDDLLRYDIASIRRAALKRMPTAALRCLGDMKSAIRLGGYLFVHAGVHPDRRLDIDDIQLLTTIREPFLSTERWQHDFVVVHGHTVCGPDILEHRVACDTGAFFTDILTCAHFRGDRVRFIAVTSRPDLSALNQIGRRTSRTERWTQVR